jgi:CheY-like chemotaxis protein
MTSEMAFECLLVSHDPAVFCTMDRILQDLAIHTNVCPNPSKAADLLADGSTDLIVIDLESGQSSELMRQIFESHMRHKPTILAVSAVDCVIPGVHVFLRKPVTPESGAKSLKAAYSRMLSDHRKHTRFTLMTRVLTMDENNRTLSVTVTNIGERGVGLFVNTDIGEDGDGLTVNRKLAVGSIVSFRVPLPGLGSVIYVQARVLWTRQYGAAGCEFVRISPRDLQILHAWLESRYQFKKPLFPV